MTQIASHGPVKGIISIYNLIVVLTLIILMRTNTKNFNDLKFHDLLVVIGSSFNTKSRGF